jgi:hypothetical protein
MAGSRQPVVHRSAYSAAFQRRLALALMSGDQQQDPVSGSNRPLQSMVNCLPRTIEAVAMQIQRPVGHDPAGAKASVPAAVERRRLQSFGPLRGGHCPPSFRCPRSGLDHCGPRARRFGVGQIDRFARKRPDRCGDFGPKLGLLRGQVAHALPYPWEAKSKPGPWRTFRLPFAGPPRLHPRKCRSDWRP